MSGFSVMGKMLIAMGIFLIIIGILMNTGLKIPWLGRLPGDISVQRENFSFYFPLTSCIIISIILTLLFYLFRR
jgi:membrane protein implicated in regulation of membrane protease activity